MNESYFCVFSRASTSCFLKLSLSLSSSSSCCSFSIFLAIACRTLQVLNRYTSYYRQIQCFVGHISSACKNRISREFSLEKDISSSFGSLIMLQNLCVSFYYRLDFVLLELVSQVSLLMLTRFNHCHDEFISSRISENLYRQQFNAGIEENCYSLCKLIRIQDFACK